MVEEQEQMSQQQQMQEDHVTILPSTEQVASMLKKVDQEENNSFSRRFYPHDFVVQTDKQFPFEWSPTFGSVVDPTHPILDIEELADKPKLDLTNWTYEDGLIDNFYVHWGSSSTLKHVQADEVTLIDRFLVKGQKVSNGQLNGIVKDTEVKVTLQILGTNHVITNVDSRKLKPISPFVRGVEILYDNQWIGIITDVQRQNTFRVETGMGAGKKFTIETRERDGFMKHDPYWSPGNNYPGQRHRLSSKFMQRANWETRGMNFLWKRFQIWPIKYLYNSPEVISVGIVPTSITVQWLQNGKQKDTTTKSPLSPPAEPSNNIPSTDFHKIQCIGIPNYETMQINSIRTFKFNDQDTKNDDIKLTSFNAFVNQFKTFDGNSNDSIVFGNRNNRQVSYFYPPDSIFTALKTVRNEIPVKVLLKKTFVDIQWENGTTEKLPASEIPIVRQPKEHYTFRSGSIVSNLQDNDELVKEKYGIVQLSEDFVTSGSNTLLVKWFHQQKQPTKVPIEITQTKEESIYNLRPHPLYTFYKVHTLVFLKQDQEQSAASASVIGGIILNIDIENGTMKLGSENGQELIVYPHQIWPLKQRSYWNFFTRKWTTDTLLPHEHQLIVERRVPVGTATTLTNLQIPIKLSSGVLEDNSDDNSSASILSSSATATAETLGTLQKSSSCLLNESKLTILEKAPCTHFYYPNQLKNVPIGYSKMIGNELELLHNLPEGIWIYSYEDRMDLLSILFLGPVDTPYEDGLFLFDIQIPKTFPNEIVKVQFINYSVQPIHPLIAMDGTFCVSKLQWNWNKLPIEEKPKSFIGNVLLQIQALLFTSSSSQGPASDETQNVRQQRMYNERIVMNVLTSTISMLINPHKPWENIIRQHYSVSIGPKLVLLTKWLQQQSSTSTNQLLSSTESDQEEEEASEDEESLNLPNSTTKQRSNPTPPSSQLSLSSPYPLPTYQLLPVSKGFKLALIDRVKTINNLFETDDSLKSIHSTLIQVDDSGYNQLKSGGLASDQDGGQVDDRGSIGVEKVVADDGSSTVEKVSTEIDDDIGETAASGAGQRQPPVVY